LVAVSSAPGFERDTHGIHPHPMPNARAPRRLHKSDIPRLMSAAECARRFCSSFCLHWVKRLLALGFWGVLSGGLVTSNIPRCCNCFARLKLRGRVISAGFLKTRFIGTKPG
jgi:hypothetical protein